MRAAPQEQVVYQDKDVTITTARAVLRGVTYSMANVTSVRSFTEPRPFVAVFFGGLVIFLGWCCNEMKFASAAEALLGAGAISILAFFLTKPRHWVRIGTAGAESNAIWSHDPQWTATVVAAINQAIVARG